MRWIARTSWGATNLRAPPGTIRGHRSGTKRHGTPWVLRNLGHLGRNFREGRFGTPKKFRFPEMQEANQQARFLVEIHTSGLINVAQ